MVFNVAQLHNMLWSLLDGLHRREQQDISYRRRVRKQHHKPVDAVSDTVLTV